MSVMENQFPVVFTLYFYFFRSGEKNGLTDTHTHNVNNKQKKTIKWYVKNTSWFDSKWKNRLTAIFHLKKICKEFFFSNIKMYRFSLFSFCFDDIWISNDNKKNLKENRSIFVCLFVTESNIKYQHFSLEKH